VRDKVLVLEGIKEIAVMKSLFMGALFCLTKPLAGIGQVAEGVAWYVGQLPPPPGLSRWSDDLLLTKCYEARNREPEQEREESMDPLSLDTGSEDCSDNQ